MYTYLLVNLLSLAYPLAQSFERRLQLYRQWRALFPAIAITGAFFIVWDVLFTSWGVWGFNPRYLSGINIGNLPLEEWLFFITIPYACIFVYEVMNYFVKRDVLGKIARPLAIALGIALLVGGALAWGKWYTSTTALLAGAALLLVAFSGQSKWLGRFFIGYAVSLVPFLLVNGLLTGSFLDEPVVWYNDAENLGIRLFTIPVEDTVYMLLLLLMNTAIYERLKAISR